MSSITVDKEFIDVFGNVGYFLRSLDINTSGRIAMLSSLVYLQKQSTTTVKFDEFYEYSLDQVDEKLELSSFKTLLSKLEEATGKTLVVEEDTNTYLCTSELLEMIDQAGKEFERRIRGN